ncbi:MAG: hypothetical protein ACR2LT_05990 [Pyrinomonadaceae bacterium]
MITQSKILLASLVLTAGILLTACPQQTSIGKIESNPSRYVGKETAVAGRVTNSFGVAMLGGIYKVDDGTGSIWVLTSRSVPSKNSQVGVKGKVQDGLSFGGKSYGLGMIEDSRRIR